MSKVPHFMIAIPEFVDVTIFFLKLCCTFFNILIFLKMIRRCRMKFKFATLLNKISFYIFAVIMGWVAYLRGVSEKYPSCVYIFFFDGEGVVDYELAPRGQTINKDVEVLKRLRDAVRRKRPRFWLGGDWLLHHDNAPALSSNLVQQFLAKQKIVQLRQPPYSPDIAPCDFWMFPKLKMALNGKRFDDIETVQSNATRELKAIPKSAFEDCFKTWKHCWERVA